LLSINISYFYKILHLFNTFLQIGKRFFTSGSYYICKFSEGTKKINHKKEEKEMKKRKKYLIVGTVILSLMVLTGLGFTAAYGPQGCWRKGYHHGFHSDDMADFILWKMYRHVKELNLDEAQMQQYAEIKEQVKTTITAAMERRRQFHDLVHNEVSKENPDLNALAVDVKNRLETLPEVIGENIDLFLELYNILNPEQKAQLIEMFRSRMG